MRSLPELNIFGQFCLITRINCHYCSAGVSPPHAAGFEDPGGTEVNRLRRIFFGTQISMMIMTTMIWLRKFVAGALCSGGVFTAFDCGWRDPGGKKACNL